MEYMLYGEGIHDDRPAIQELLDSKRRQDCEQTNLTGMSMPFIENHGAIDKLILDSIETGNDDILKNMGEISYAED